MKVERQAALEALARIVGAGYALTDPERIAGALSDTDAAKCHRQLKIPHFAPIEDSSLPPVENSPV